MRRSKDFRFTISHPLLFLLSPGRFCQLSPGTISLQQRSPRINQSPAKPIDVQASQWLTRRHHFLNEFSDPQLTHTRPNGVRGTIIFIIYDIIVKMFMLIMRLHPYILSVCCYIYQNCLHGKQIQVSICIVQACSLEISNWSFACQQKCILEQH